MTASNSQICRPNATRNRSASSGAQVYGARNQIRAYGGYSKTCSPYRRPASSASTPPMKMGISPAVLPRYCRLSTGSVAIARRNAAAVVRAAGDSLDQIRSDRVDQIRSDRVRADQIRSAEVNRGPYAVAVLALAVLVFFAAAARVAFAAFSAVFRCSDVCTPNFLLNRSTRPSVSISF